LASLNRNPQNNRINIGTTPKVRDNEDTMVIAMGGIVDATGVATIIGIKTSNFTEYLKVKGWKSEYESVSRLLRHLLRKSGSEASRIAYLRVVHRFCKRCGFQPDELLRLEKREIEKLVQDFCDDLLDKDCSRRYISTVLHVLLTFFRVNGFKELNVEHYHVPARYRKREEYVPTKNEVYEMVDNAGNLKNRAIILSLYSSGLRVSTLAALTLGDIREELEKGYSVIKILVYAEMKKRVPEACKGKIEYYTFICEEATKAVRLYMTERVRRFGSIKDEEPLFASDCRRVEKVLRRMKFLTRREVEYVVKDAARRAGVKNWELVTPHCLRKAFESVLRSELIDGGRLDPKDQEYLMGHVLPGCQDAYYDKSKIENLRSEYARLNFGRKIIENKFKTLEITLSKAFADTGVDWRKVLKEYARGLP